jgi:hypothetical protein
MDWKKERDLLIAQTLAFVQSAAGRKAGAEAIAGEMPDVQPHIEAAATEIREIFERPVVAQPVVPEPAKAVQVSAHIPRGLVANDFRTEIQARVVSFRAHQQRFDREREEFFSSTLGKARAAVRNEPAPPPARQDDH